MLNTAPNEIGQEGMKYFADTLKA
ncbi:unnamed protein product, partial [Rotaria sp. Silwood2]